MDQEKINAYNLEQKRKVDEQSAKEVQKDNADGISKTVAASNGMVANIVAQSNKKTQDATKEVGTAVKDAGNSILEAMTSSQNQVAEALNNLVIATVVSKDPQLIQAAKDVTSLISSIAKAGEDFSKSNLNALPSSLDKLTTAIQEMISEDATDADPDYTTVLDDIKKLLAKDVKEPVVNVSAPNVTVDTSAFEKAIKSLEKTIQANKVVIPKSDSSAVIDAVTSVKNAVEGQRFPVPNYVLPFKDINGAAAQVQLDASGNLPITASISGADGALLDGVSSAIRATVLDLTTSNPLTVGIVDGTGAQITSFGGGTQYTEDVAAAADPVGTSVNLVRKDTPAAITTTDGDNVAQRGTNYGAAYTQVVTSTGAFVDTFGGGTQYADGAARGTATGTVVMGDDGTLIQSITAKTLGTQVVSTDTGLVVNAAIHGITTAGGGAYVDVKVNPSGALTADVSGSTLAANSGVDIGDVTINNAAGAAAVNIQDGGNSITVDGTVAVSTNSELGIVTETAPATDTASSGLNGRLQRIAQRLTSLITALGSPFQAGGSIGNTSFAATQATGTNLHTVVDSGNIAVTGSVTATLASTTITGTVAVTDNAGSLTVDAPVGTPAFVRLSDGAAAITTLPVSLASVPSHAVTNAGTFAVQTSATSTGGYTPGKLVSAATTNATVIKASAGTLGHISASNVNAAARYLKFYNKATAPTVGTDVPVLTYIIPGNTAGAGTNIPLPPQGINFSTGISFATTTEATDAGSTGVAVSEIVINYAFN